MLFNVLQDFLRRSDFQNFCSYLSSAVTYVIRCTRLASWSFTLFMFPSTFSLPSVTRNRNFAKVLAVEFVSVFCFIFFFFFFSRMQQHTSHCIARTDKIAYGKRYLAWFRLQTVECSPSSKRLIGLNPVVIELQSRSEFFVYVTEKETVCIRNKACIERTNNGESICNM